MVRSLTTLLPLSRPVKQARFIAPAIPSADAWSPLDKLRQRSEKGGVKKMKGVRINTYACVVVTFILFCLFFSSAAKAQAPTVTIISPTAQSPVQKNLVSDIPGLATTTDPNLVNPWGISN